jgi:hypothetical protein
MTGRGLIQCALTYEGFFFFELPMRFVCVCFCRRSSSSVRHRARSGGYHCQQKTKTKFEWTTSSCVGRLVILYVDQVGPCTALHTRHGRTQCGPARLGARLCFFFVFFFLILFCFYFSVSLSCKIRKMFKFLKLQFF